MRFLEQEIQIAIAHYLKGLEAHTRKRFTFFHVPNGGKRGKSEAAKLKAMGVRAGVPDLIIFFNSIIAPPLFIELKAGKGSLNVNQKEYHAQLKELNYEVLILTAHDKRDGVDQIEAIMKEKLA